MKSIALLLTATLIFVQGCSSSGGGNNEEPESPGNLSNSSSIDIPSFLPSASSAHQFDYTMTSVTGGSTIARALLFEPNGEAPSDGHRLVVWAHGTTGIANSCAPSGDFSNLGNRNAIESLLNAGYAVLAPDYEGFGEPTVHPYYVRSSHANSVIDAVPAAHQLQGINISDNWAVIGHSQGGHVALAAARAEQYPAFVLQAVVALAPGTDIAPLVERVYTEIDRSVSNGDIQSAANRTYFLNLYAAYIAHALELVEPNFDAMSIFGEDVSPLIDIAVDEVDCGDYAQALVVAFNAHVSDGGTLDDFAGLRRDWYTDPIITGRLATEEMGDELQTMPLLVVQGNADLQIPVDATTAFVDRQRSAGTDVTYQIIDGAGHGNVVGGDFGRAVIWLAERFPAR